MMRFLRLILLGAIGAALFGLQPARSAAAGPVPEPAVLLDQRDTAGRGWLTSAGAQQLADYGAFSLWELPAAQVERAASEQPKLRRAGTRILLRGLTIDTSASQPEPLLPYSLRAAAAPQKTSRLWMIQFAGPLQDAWLDSLHAAGQIVAACLPEYTCILWGPDASAAVQNLGKLARWSGPFHPAYRLHPALRPGGRLRQAVSSDMLEVTIQFLNVPASAADLAVLKNLAETASSGPHAVLNYLNIHARIPIANLDRLSALPTLFNIEPYTTPVKHDEMQAQILAGQIGSTPGVLNTSGPGYLNWLTLRGFSTNPDQYPVVDIVDDGIDDGTTAPLHPDFYAYPTGQPSFSRISFQRSCLADGTTNGVDGHGNLNAGIMAGYNATGGGMPDQDAAGYAFGLGISPFGRIAGTKIFGAVGYDISACRGTYTGIVADAYAAGADITSNSWGSNVFEYDSGAQEYDALTRDASPSEPGDQQMLHIFSAGNQGNYKPGSTVGSPGTAKNVLTVGATDLPRDVDVYDGCDVLSSASAANIASYSSRGPTSDGRVKPDLVAPGTHIQGPASQDPGYATSGLAICGGPSPNKHYYPPTSPIQQKLYTISDGTSHAAPAVAGAAQLAWERYMTQFGRPAPPSPAMLKALLLNIPRYLNGYRSGGDLPSVSQGWGMPDLNTAFDLTPRFLLDQTHIFEGSGETYTISGIIADSSKPFHVSLVWTDAPGTAIGAALVNDLDLEVTVSTSTYLGNIFSGANSSLGGFSDERNNVENVFLPAGSTGSFTIRVVAHNIAGNGVPEHSGATDQDFALVVYNGKVEPAPILSFQSSNWQEDPDPAASNNNGRIEPGESAYLSVRIKNSPTAIEALTISGTLGLLPTQANLLSTDPGIYSNLQAGTTGDLIPPFKVYIQPGLSCATALESVLHLSYTYVRTPTTLTGSIDLPIPSYTLCNGKIYYFNYLPLVAK